MTQSPENAESGQPDTEPKVERQTGEQPTTQPDEPPAGVQVEATGNKESETSDHQQDGQHTQPETAPVATVQRKIRGRVDIPAWIQAGCSVVVVVLTIVIVYVNSQQAEWSKRQVDEATAQVAEMKSQNDLLRQQIGHAAAEALLNQRNTLDQITIAKDGLGETRRQAAANMAAVRTQQRAYVFTKDVTLDNTALRVGPIAGRILIRNYGQTPAVGVSVVAAAKVDTNEDGIDLLSKRNLPGFTTQFKSVVDLGPGEVFDVPIRELLSLRRGTGGDYFFREFLLSEQQLDSILMAKQQLIVQLEIAYRDVFQGQNTPPNITVQCFFTSGNSARFVPCNRNRAIR